MQNVSMKTMLEAGVHFGHQTSRWNPKMARYIFGERNGIHILDLQKTFRELKKAYTFVKEQAKAKKKILFVGTKKQAQEVIKTEAERADCPAVYEKWLGGTLTNFATIRKSIDRFNELEKWEKEGLFKVISKKEVSRLSKELARLKKLLTGIREMNALPDIMFTIDPTDNAGAVAEAKKLGIPVVAVCDTNSDPDSVDVPIPGNDDAARAIKLFCGLVADAVIEGRAEASADAAAVQAKQDEEMTAEQPSVSAEGEPIAPITEEPAAEVDADPSTKSPKKKKRKTKTEGDEVDTPAESPSKE